MRRFAPAVALVATFAACSSAPKADLVLVGGKVVTVDSQHPAAQAVAVRGDRIVAVGTDAEVRAMAGRDTRVVDLQGRLLIPGFIEGHGHYTYLGDAKLMLDLTTATSWDGIVTMVADAAKKAKPGEWIVGWGWHQDKWTSTPTPNVEGIPLHASLDAVSGDHPVLLSHASGHAIFVNAAALAKAGITRTTKDPAGGQIIHDAKGEPTGFLRETAQDAVDRAKAKDEQRSPAERDARVRQLIQLAGEEARANGVTSFQDAGTDFATIDVMAKMADEGALPVRLWVMVREPNALMDSLLPKYRMVGRGNGFLTVRAIKRQIDGALGTRGALLEKPYDDLPSSSGLTLDTPAEIEATAQLAIKHGFQLGTHAIGDRASREVLDIYERTFKAHPEARDLRWRNEHASMLDSVQVARMKALGIIAAEQGIFIPSDGDWIPKRVGPVRSRIAYPWRALWDAGVIVGNGTDVPVERIDPIASYYGSVARRTPSGQVFNPEQKVTREEALRAYTLNNAYAAFEEKEKGSITVGKLADLVVLTKDLLTMPEEEIPSTRVAMTVLGGKVVYEKK